MIALCLLAQLAAGDLAERVAELAHLRPETAAHLVSQVRAAAAVQGVEPEVLAAVVMQESRFRGGALHCVFRRARPSELTCDMGLGQVNDLWVQKWRLDPARLRGDDSYTLAVSARILGRLRRRYAATEPGTWFSRYHSATPSYRRRYQARVTSWLALLRDSCPPLPPCGPVASR